MRFRRLMVRSTQRGRMSLLVAVLGLLATVVGSVAVPSFARQGADRAAVRARLARQPGRPAAAVRLGSISGRRLRLALPRGRHAHGSNTVVGREVPALRTRKSRTVRLADGRYVLQVFHAPVNYRDRAGRWAPIDDRLARVASRDAWQNRADAYRARLPVDLSSAPVRFSAPGAGWVSFRTVGASGTGVAGQATARYANVLPGVSESYSTDATGLTETLRLSGRSAAQALRFSVAASRGLRAKMQPNGDVVFSRAGQAVFRFAAPFALAASGSGPRHSVASRITRAANDWRLTYRLNRGWVARQLRAGRIVIVDPGVSLAANGGLECSLDANTPTTSSCGATTDRVGLSGSDHHTLMHFDLASLPATAEVQEAFLHLQVASAANANAKTIGAYQLTRSFTTAANWNTYDGTHAWTTAGGDTAANPVWTKTMSGAGGYDFIVDSLVRGWQDGSMANNGVEFKETPSQPANEFFVNSTTAASSPSYLSIFYYPRLGDQKADKVVSQTLSDRSDIGVNVTNGNLLVHNHDIHIAGRGSFDLALDRVYNSLSPDTNSFGMAWRAAPTKDTYMHVDPDDYSIYAYLPSGAVHAFKRQADGSYLSAEGVDATLTEEAGSNRGAFQLKVNTTGVIYRFSGAGLGADERLNWIKDRNGNQISLAYDGSGNLTTLTDSRNRTLTATTTSGRVTKLTESTGRIWQYGYTGSLMTSYTDPANKTTQYQYGAGNGMTQITSPAGRVTKITYMNAAGGDLRVQTITRVDNISAGTGPTTTFAYNAAPDATCPSPAVERTVVTDPKSHATTYCVDTHGRVTKTVDAKGNPRSATYTADDDVLSFTNGAANSSYTHDALNNLTGGQTPTAGSFTLTYGTPDTNPALKYQPQKVTNGQSSSSYLGYDALGNTTSIGDAASSPANKAVLTYYADGALKTATDGNARVTNFGENTLGEMTSVAPPAVTAGTQIGTTTLTYDGESRVKTLKDGKAQTRTYTDDALDRITRIDFSDGSFVTFTYDADGYLTSRVDSVVGTTNYSPDLLGRVTHQGFPDGSSADYTYDAASNLGTFANAGGTVTYSYDELDRATGVAQPTGSCTGTITLCTTLGYDTHGNQTSVSYPNGLGITRTFDNSDHVKTIVAKQGATTLKSKTYTYDTTTTSVCGSSLALHTELRQTLVDEANQTTTYCYDGLDRLTRALTKSSGGSTVYDYQYGYDNASNISTWTRTTPVNPTTTFTLAYNEDNMLCWRKGSVVTNPTCGSPPSGAQAWTYDANGNRLANGEGQNITYNAKDQIATINPFAGGTSANVTYDGPDMTEQVAGGTANYQQTLVGEAITNDGNGLAYNDHAPDGTLLSTRRGSSRYYYVGDALGSIISATDSAGATAWSEEYSPFGEAVTSSGSLNPRFRWLAAPIGSSEIYHFGNRYYDPDAMRWTQADPIYVPGAVTEANRYLYVGENPINRIDPSGRGILDDIAHAGEALEGIGAAAGAVATGIVAAPGCAAAVATTVVLAVPCAGLYAGLGTVAVAGVAYSIHNVNQIAHRRKFGG
jgi:RHS repeat-associated protein